MFAPQALLFIFGYLYTYTSFVAEIKLVNRNLLSAERAANVLEHSRAHATYACHSGLVPSWTDNHHLDAANGISSSHYRTRYRIMARTTKLQHRCDCQRYCKSDKPVSYSTWKKHKPFRIAQSAFVGAAKQPVSGPSLWAPPLTMRMHRTSPKISAQITQLTEPRPQLCAPPRWTSISTPDTKT